MKLKKITIRAFGRFEKQSWAVPQDLAVFYGPNEAGKTTLAVFIKQVLFGFPARQKRYDLFLDYSPLSGANPMGGSLTFTDGSDTYVLERLKQAHHADQVKLTRNGTEVPVSLFYEKSRDVDGAFYQDSFVFDQDQLASVTALSRQDLLDRVYFLGAAQSQRLEQIKDQVDGAAEELFKARGKKPALNQLIARHAEAQERFTELKGEQAGFADERQRYADLRQELAKLEKQQQRLHSQFEHNNNLLQKLPVYQQLQDLQQTKPSQFDEANYQKAQAVAAQLASFSSPEDYKLDMQKAEKLLGQKLTVTNWLNEQKNARQKEANLQKDLAQQKELQPQAAKLANLSTAELAQLRQDWPQQKTNAAHKIDLVVGLVFALLAVLVFNSRASLALVFGLAAGGFLAAYFLQNKKSAKDDSFQDKYGFEPNGASPDALINAVVTIQNLQNKLAACQQEQKELAAKLTTFQQKLGQVLPETSSDVLQDLGRLEQLAAAAKASRAQKAKQQELNLQLQKVLNAAGASSWADYQERYRQHLLAVQKQTQVQALAEQLGADLPQLKELAKHEAAFRQTVNKQAAELKELVANTDKLRQQAADLQAELRHEASSDDVARQSQEVSQLASQIVQKSQDYLAGKLAAELIQKTLGLASHNSFPKMMTVANSYLALLTGKHYDRIIWPSKGRGLKLQRSDGQKLPLRNLSRGTAEQLYFALKLAFVQKAAGEVDLPLLIDDAFVNFDPARRTYMQQLLKQLAADRQVLVFTADEQLAQSLGPKYINLNEVQHA